MLPTWIGRFASRVSGTSCDLRFTLAPALALAGSVAMVGMPQRRSNEHALRATEGEARKRRKTRRGMGPRAFTAKGASLGARSADGAE
jgi:hypothetical protein